MKVYINDSLYRVESLKEGPFQLKYDLDKDKKVEIRLELDKSFIPSQIGTGDDERELSIVINSVTVY